MKFGDIFPLLLVLLILYYAAMIAMDLYKAKLEKEAEKENNTEEDIDISDEAATFQPIRITRDDPKKTKAADPDTTADNADSINAESKGDKSKNDESQMDKPKSEHHAPALEVKPDETVIETPEASASDAKEETVKTNPYDPSNWEIPKEILQERHHKEHETDDEVSTSKTVESIAPPVLHEPIMDGGLLIEDIYELANNVAEQGNADLQNIVMKCESD